MAKVWVQGDNSVWTSQPERPGGHPGVESQSSRTQGRCQAWKELCFEISNLLTDCRARMAWNYTGQTGREQGQRQSSIVVLGDTSTCL